MIKNAIEVDLREAPRRPFGVYVLIALLLLGIAAAALEILRVQARLVNEIWLEADEFLAGGSGFVSLAGRLFEDAGVLTIANGVIIAVWILMIAGLWALQRWAWVALMIFTGITLTYALARYFTGEHDYVSMALNVIIAFYLNDRSVQQAFARRQPEAAT